MSASSSAFSIRSSPSSWTLNDRISSLMESIYAIIAGLGLRYVVDSVSRHDFKITGTLVGLWEGVILLHFLKKLPKSTDPYLAFAVRLFIDFMFTESISRLVLVLAWTGIGMILADVAPAIWEDVGLRRVWRRFRRELYIISENIPTVVFFPPTRTVRFSPSREPSVIEEEEEDREPDVDAHTEARSVVSSTSGMTEQDNSANIEPTPIRRRLPGYFPGTFSDTESVLSSVVGHGVRPPSSFQRDSERTGRRLSVYPRPTEDLDFSDTSSQQNELEDDIRRASSSSSSSTVTGDPGDTTRFTDDIRMTEDFDTTQLTDIPDEDGLEEQRVVEATENVVPVKKKDEGETTPKQSKIPFLLPPTPSDSHAPHTRRLPIESHARPLSASIPQIPDMPEDVPSDGWEKIQKEDASDTEMPWEQVQKEDAVDATDKPPTPPPKDWLGEDPPSFMTSMNNKTTTNDDPSRADETADININEQRYSQPPPYVDFDNHDDIYEDHPSNMQPRERVDEMVVIKQREEEEKERQRLAEEAQEKKGQEEAAERKRLEEAEAERKRKEDEVAAERKRKGEAAAVERKRKEEKEAAERKRKEEEEAERKRQEEEEAAERKRKEEEEAERKRQEEEEAAERKRQKDEAAERKRQEDEAAERKRREDEVAERKRQEDEAAERKRREDEVAERKRQEDEAAEKKRLEDEVAERKRQEDEAADKKCLEDEAEKKRLEEEAEKKRLEEEAVERQRQEEATAEKKRLDEETAEKKRLEEAAAQETLKEEEEAAENKRKEAEAEKKRKEEVEAEQKRLDEAAETTRAENAEQQQPMKERERLEDKERGQPSQTIFAPSTSVPTESQGTGQQTIKEEPPANEDVGNDEPESDEQRRMEIESVATEQSAVPTDVEDRLSHILLTKAQIVDLLSHIDELETRWQETNEETKGAVQAELQHSWKVLEKMKRKEQRRREAVPRGMDPGPNDRDDHISFDNLGENDTKIRFLEKLEELLSPDATSLFLTLELGKKFGKAQKQPVLQVLTTFNLLGKTTSENRFNTIKVPDKLFSEWVTEYRSLVTQLDDMDV